MSARCGCEDGAGVRRSETERVRRLFPSGPTAAEAEPRKAWKMLGICTDKIVFRRGVCYHNAMQNDFGLNERQLAAVTDTEGAVLVIAGAGSGKTRVLTARICALVEKGVSPYNILAITFTNKAANEMKERIARYLGEEAGVWASTFHSLCARILRVHGWRLGYDRNFTIYTDLESERVVKRVCERVNADPKHKGEYLYHISAAKTAGLSPAEYFEQINPFVKEAHTIVSVFSAYEEELKISDALDFDDLLLKAVQLFEQFPEVREEYARRFRYICVDEFQDTNRLQYRLVRMLASVWGNLFVVGDEDQNIYSWRGAEIRNILDFHKDYPDVRVYKLEQNYRSTTAILDAANRVIKNNASRNDKTLWSANGEGEAVEYYEAYGDRDEADFVSRKINYLVRQGADYRDCAVLVRINSLTRVLEENFTLNGIPYKVFGGFRFFERKEIKDTLAYVRLALNPADNDSFLRVVNYPRRGIGAVAVSEVSMLAATEKTSIMQVMAEGGKLSAASARKLAPFYETVKDITAAAGTMEPEEFMSFVISRSGLENTLKGSADPEDANRYDNIQELVGAVHGFMEDNPEATISDFMESVSLVSDSDAMDEENYVTVATVHAVKGLEFDNVFIVGLEEGIFPVSKAVIAGDVEEERRLMYVALTRARKRLFVLSSRSRFKFGETVYNPKSRFITEMRGEKQSVRAGAAAVDMQSASRAERLEALTRKVASTPRPTAKPQSAVSTDEFVKDTIVEHSKFGRGIIISTTGEGEDKVAAIAFKGLGVKRFALAVAASSLKVVKD